MQFFKKLNLLGLSLIFSACVGLPKLPQTSLCAYDNASPQDGAVKPHFKCINHDDVRFKVYFDSPSADKFIAMPYQDYLEMQAFYKKLFSIFEREFLNKVGK